MSRRTVIFDLGGVVLSWDPVQAFNAAVDAEQARRLMREIGFAEWNRRRDAGHPFAAGEREVADRFPQYAKAITAYRRHFDATLTGPVPGTSAVVAELAKAGVRLLGLTNFSDETFPIAERRFGILRRLEAIVVSGRERITKPDPRLYRLLLDRYQVAAANAVFVDDNPGNCEAARDLGLRAIDFVGADDLRSRLVGMDLLGERPEVREPLFHTAERIAWDESVATGAYPWSGHGATFEAEGFVHLAYGHQIRGVIDRYFGRFEPEKLVLLELDPTRARPVVEEGTVESFPHLYAPLEAEMVVAEHAVRGGFTDPD
ncbi:MAG: HAD-IA family hydrolase [Microlunatus sp.]|nr:HAD-IA family hydrolase [Microlunatus sp.]MDN5805050.1 HAD-IA family hydrolase [Microlunatus sp.]